MRNLSYIDPGTGSLFLQVIAGGVLAFGVTFRSVIRKVFHKTKNNVDDQTTVDEKE